MGLNVDSLLSRYFLDLSTIYKEQFRCSLWKQIMCNAVDKKFF